MALDKDLKLLKFDVRIQEWSVRNGQVKQSEIETHLKELPDVSNNAVPLDLEEKSGSNGSH
jgi:hypothetical protein